jgi:hypothetical protein
VIHDGQRFLVAWVGGSQSVYASQFRVDDSGSTLTVAPVQKQPIVITTSKNAITMGLAHGVGTVGLVWQSSSNLYSTTLTFGK